MGGKIFRHDGNLPLRLAKELGHSGSAIGETTMLERAECKRDQVHAFGADWRIERCKGSMRAVLEPTV